MCDKQFYKWKSDTLKKAKSAGSLKGSLRLLAAAISSNYPGIKLWFTKKLGKRESYIAGAGEEQYITPQKYSLNCEYNLFLQNDNIIAKEEKNEIIKMCRLLLAIIDI